MPSDLSVHDFAAALRQMADNADRVADRHDVLEMDQLHVKIGILTARAQRGGDLIAELRRQARSMGRSLDGLCKLRKTAQLGERSGDVLLILADALLLISESPCRNFTGSHSCRDESSGRTRRTPFDADTWCSPCIAWDALERAGWTDA